MGNRNIVHQVKTRKEFERLHNSLTKRGFVAINTLRPGSIHSIGLGEKDPSDAVVQDMTAEIRRGSWCNGPLRDVAFSLDERNNTVQSVPGADGKPLGLGYIKWGAGDCIPSTLPVWAQSLPYTAAPLRYIADLIAGLGPKLMYRFPDDKLVE